MSNENVKIPPMRRGMMRGPGRGPGAVEKPKDFLMAVLPRTFSCHRKTLLR